MKLLQSIFMLAIVLLFFSCDGYKSSDEGYKYKYVTNGEGTLVKETEYVQLNLRYTDEKDSLLFESTPDRPVILPYEDITSEKAGPLLAAFKKVGLGDSMIFKIPTKNVFEESIKRPVPESLDPEGNMFVYAKAVKIFTTEEYNQWVENMRKELMAADEKRHDEEIVIIEEYLAENNIEAKSTESGLHYVIEKEGKGDFIKVGDSLKIHYTGTLLNGEKFDSSLDKGEPLVFQLMPMGMIGGWIEGLTYFKRGGKGMLIIPSSLGYGSRDMGTIKPNSILKFEIEVLE